jgi:hypothetical protein
MKTISDYDLDCSVYAAHHSTFYFCIDIHDFELSQHYLEVVFYSFD